MEESNDITNQSGGVSIEGDVRVGNDVVGRDKIVHITHSTTDEWLDVQYRMALDWDGKSSLRGINFSNRDFRNVKLPGCDLKGSRFIGTRLEGADLHEANLDETDFSEASLQDVNLRGARLYLSKLSINQLTEARSLRNAFMPDGRMYDGRLNLRVDLEDCSRDFWDAMQSIIAVKVQEEIRSMSYRKASLKERRGFHGLDNEIRGALGIEYANAMLRIYGDFGKDLDQRVSDYLAHWYGVSVEDFRDGQSWARLNNRGGFERVVLIYFFPYLIEKFLLVYIDETAQLWAQGE
jgi:hypothetical protein